MEASPTIGTPHIRPGSVAFVGYNPCISVEVIDGNDCETITP
jgi:hypothetical protein